jgi:hypothetical protein
MKRAIWVCLLVALFSVPLLGSAETYILARFNLPEQSGRDNYLPGGPGDILTSATYFQRAWPAGVTQPQLIAPDIVTPPAGGFDGGNALKSNSDDSGKTRQGYYVEINPPITGDFTAEVVFRLFDLNPTYCEHKMQNILSTWWCSGSTPDNSNMHWELRFFGSEGDLGMNNNIQVMTNNPAEHNITSGPNALTVDTWYHAGVVYDDSANLVTLYLNGSVVGTANPSWTTTSPGGHAHKMACIVLAAWPNDAGTCRDIAGFIDAFALSNEVLAPGSFVLRSTAPTPTPWGYAAVDQGWTLYE